ncbi:hypothetical protein LMG3410_05565 [Achromobacter aegrifaciens]|nr:hypothetical protein LMG3410_05565 [Achromobacter aegrifaciens]
MLRTLTRYVNVDVTLVPNNKGNNESAPDYCLQAVEHDIGAARRKPSTPVAPVRP